MGGQEVTEDDFVFVPLEELTSPSDGFFEHLKDRWWLVHPDKGLAFYNPRNGRTNKRKPFTQASPQCNRSEAIARRIARICPGTEVRFVPSVFKSIDISDYGNYDH